MVERIKHRMYTKLPSNTKLVARPSKYGNPYKLSEYSREEALMRYEDWLLRKYLHDACFFDSLKGYNLACYCSLEDDCHVDILIKFIEEIEL